jgi:renalase
VSKAADRVPVIVVGGGICGISCARALADAGLVARVLDRGRAIGGRMATRRLGGPGLGRSGAEGHRADIGASYFTARDPAFIAVVEALVAAGVVRPWTDSLHVWQDGTMLGRRPGPMRFTAPGGLRTVVEALAAGLPSAPESSTAVTSVQLDEGSAQPLVAVERSGGAAVTAPERGVALCMPGPQADRLLVGGHPAIERLRIAAAQVPWEPVIAVTAGFDALAWEPFDGVFVNGDPTLTWIANDGSRRGNGAPVLVAHVTPALAATCLDDPDRVIAPALEAMRRVLRMDAEPAWVDVQRWTYAKPMSAAAEPCFLDPQVPIGLAGDAWAGGPRVEAAWLSGRALGEALAGRIGEALAGRMGEGVPG